MPSSSAWFAVNPFLQDLENETYYVRNKIGSIPFLY